MIGDTNRRDEFVNYYEVLHVQQSAPLPIIKNAYRALMQSMKAHPDLGGDVAQATLINEAYTVLSHEKKRAVYDQQLENHIAERDTLRGQRKQSRDQNTHQSIWNNAGSQYVNAADVYEAEPIDKTGYTTKQTYSDQIDTWDCAFCKRTHQTSVLDCANCHSPMEPPKTDFASNDAERAITRIEADTPIEISCLKLNERIEGTLRDMSPLGLGFESFGKLETHSVVKIDCARFCATARIAHARVVEHRSGHAPRYLYGAQFTTLRLNSQSGTFISMKL